MAEMDRTTWLLVKIDHHSNESEERKIAVELKRRVQLEMMDEAQVFLGEFIGTTEDSLGVHYQFIGKLVTDDYSDDLGEEWHAHDWQSHERVDEGLHEGVT